jgi:Fic-DOC domain mobile mystery protein B
MGLDLDYIDGQTPIDEDEKVGLRIKSISTQGELDEFEQQNIEHAILWLKKRKLKQDEILTESFVRKLHKQMFGQIWLWAGEYRKTNKNIGVDKFQIAVQLRILLNNCKYWIDNQTFPPREIAIRFKYELVKIHCFANGNGRHSRLMADILASQIFGLGFFTWGNANLVKHSDSRKHYLSALREADIGNFEPLIKFAVS